MLRKMALLISAAVYCDPCMCVVFYVCFGLFLVDFGCVCLCCYLFDCLFELCIVLCCSAVVCVFVLSHCCVFVCLLFLLVVVAVVVVCYVCAL